MNPPYVDIGRAIEILGQRLRVAGDIVLHPYFFTDAYDFPILCDIDAERICLLCDCLGGIEWTAKNILQETKDIAEYFNIKLQAICDPFRWAIAGAQNGPDLFAIAEYLGKEETLFRLRRSFLPGYYRGIEEDLRDLRNGTAQD
ncbi:MAG: hypothetical protein M0R80_07930 [Proteobacteria bacterium]|jgi:hypothetical protein|nr:hypothetical protein [Pseudomonadota bacterium]